MNKIFEYSVAIRTLGTAGDCYIKEIQSLCRQSILPQKIVVYIANGYPIPKAVANEVYVVVPKGMVAQRALDYKEIETDFVLLLDDDVYLPDNCVEVLYKEMLECHGDCIAADVFQPHLASFKSILYDCTVNLSFPSRDELWAFKVRNNASFSYNRHPTKGVYKSQSAAGPISLWRKEVLVGIHYQDELWLDQMGFAFGDDQLMFQKVYKNGYNLLVSYDSGAIHLNAKSSSRLFQRSSEKFYTRSKALYMLWYRSCYHLDKNSKFKKLNVGLCFFIKQLHLLFIHIITALVYKDAGIFFNFLKGNLDGINESRKKIKLIPNFILR